MSLRENLLETLKSNRPQLSNSSANTYSSLLVNLAKKMNIEQRVKDIKKFESI